MSTLLLSIRNHSNFRAAESGWICVTGECNEVLKLCSLLKCYSFFPLEWVPGDIITWRVVPQPHFQPDFLQRLCMGLLFSVWPIIVMWLLEKLVSLRLLSHLASLAKAFSSFSKRKDTDVHMQTLTLPSKQAQVRDSREIFLAFLH